jgi:hypothetical protein
MIFEMNRWIGFIILVLVLSCDGCVDSLLLYPTTRPEPAGGAVERLIDRDGKKIQVWVAHSQRAAQAPPQAMVLDFTGNATRAEWVVASEARRWGSKPVEIWVMNYPGYGGSSGRASVGAIPPAALAVYDTMAAENPGKPIFVTGISLGCATALSVASRRPTAGMVLQNPPPIQRMILQEHGWWNLWLGAGAAAMQIPPEMDALATAPRVKVPAVFIMSRMDRTVPYSYQRLVFEAYAGEKRSLLRETADHNTPLAPSDEQAFQQLLDWLWSRAAVPGNAQSGFAPPRFMLRAHSRHQTKTASLLSMLTRVRSKRTEGSQHSLPGSSVFVS